MPRSQTPQSTSPTHGLTVYQVGGSVRDALLNLPVKDRDYVVVGADPETMIARGFRPVGKDFPVFLHPDTHEEYALARTERKTAPGYRGFSFNASPEVTLEEDLARRDLTINAMAIDADGQLIDPFNGRLDLAQGRLRHVSEAFVEDPVRVLRLARFATRFASFEIAESTLALCHSMAASGELGALVSERVWAELSQALMYAQPSRMVLALVEMHALAKIWPKLDQARYSDAYRDALNGLDAAAEAAAPLALRFAVLCLTMRPEAVKHSLQSLKVPNRCGFWADWAVHRLGQLWGIRHHRPEDVLGFIQSLDALRQPERVESLRVLASAWAHSGAQADSGEADVQFLQGVLAQMDCIDAQALAAQGLTGPQMADAISQARLACIERCQREAQ
jgi:tRNA nucleotidyltransferase (CCA-adding enzyme)